jgi:Flp pilus assembly protein TadG
MRFRNFLMSQTKARRLRSFWRERKATSAIELALVLPLIAGMIVPLADLGLGAYTKMQVENAAQAGADYALKTGGFNSTNISNAVTNATGLTGVSATPAPSESCACVGGTPATITNTTAPPCSTGCASGNEGVYVTVNAQASYAPLFPYPAIPSPITFNATSTVRIQ